MFQIASLREFYMILKKILRTNPQNKEEHKYYFVPVQGNSIQFQRLSQCAAVAFSVQFFSIILSCRTCQPQAAAHSIRFAIQKQIPKQVRNDAIMSCISVIISETWEFIIVIISSSFKSLSIPILVSKDKSSNVDWSISNFLSSLNFEFH